MRYHKIKITVVLIIFIAVFFIFFDYRHFNNSAKFLPGDSIGKIINGKKQGEWRFYYLTGQLKEVRHYIDDKKTANLLLIIEMA